jgi:hypothetical protein
MLQQQYAVLLLLPALLHEPVHHTRGAPLVAVRGYLNIITSKHYCSRYVRGIKIVSQLYALKVSGSATIPALSPLLGHCCCVMQGKKLCCAAGFSWMYLLFLCALAGRQQQRRVVAHCAARRVLPAVPPSAVPHCSGLERVIAVGVTWLDASAL